MLEGNSTKRSWKFLVVEAFSKDFTTVLDRNLLGLFCNKQSGCVLCVGSDFSPYKCVTVVIMPTTDSVYYYQWTY